MIQILKSSMGDNSQHQNSSLLCVLILLSHNFIPSTNARVSADTRSGITSNWNYGAWTCMCQEYELCFTCPWQTLKQWFTYITIHISWFASDIINYSNLLRTNYLWHISRPISKSPQVIHQRDIGMYNKLSREFKCLRCVYTCIPHIPKAVKIRFPKTISSADIH